MISGYAPDYVGQLIRSGKIIGKKVYSNTAWLTTEAAVKNYLQKRPGAKEAILFKGMRAGVIGKFNNGTFPEYKLMRVFRVILWFIIFLFIIFFFILFYIFSVNFEKNVNQKVIEKSKYELFR